MRNLLRAMLLACVLVAVSGCGINGCWTLESIKPETAKANFEYTTICLSKSGDYCAAVKTDDEVKRLTGTYKFDRAAQTLSFSTEGGPERVYKAQLMCPGSKLKVWGDTPVHEWTATMKRGTCCAGGKCVQPTSGCFAGAEGGKPCSMKQCPMMKKEEAKAQSPAQEAKQPAETPGKNPQ